MRRSWGEWVGWRLRAGATSTTSSSFAALTNFEKEDALLLVHFFDADADEDESDVDVDGL